MDRIASLAFRTLLTTLAFLVLFATLAILLGHRPLQAKGAQASAAGTAALIFFADAANSLSIISSPCP
jgi:hypothetical protein